MTRCLLVACEFFPIVGGAGTNAINLARGLSELGISVELLTFDFGQDCALFDSRLPFRVIRFSGTPPATRIAWFTEAIRLSIWLRKKGDLYNFVLLTDWISDVLMNIAFTFSHVPFSTYVHGSEVNTFRDHPAFRLLTYRLYNRASTCLCNSKFTQTLLLNNYPNISKEKVHVLPVSVAFPDLESLPSQRKVYRKKLAINDHNFVLFQLSRVVDRKGHRIVIEALGAMTPHERAGLQYLVGGTGPEKASLQQLAEELCITDSVLFLGNISVDDLPGHYDACDAFIMPSLEVRGRVEGFGAVYIEAALRSKAAIASRHGAVPEVVLDGETGLLADTGDSEDLRGKILALRSDPDLCRRMGQAAEARARDEFFYRYVAKKLINLLCPDYLDKIDAD